MNINEKIQISIIRLFTGEATPDEKKVIREWLNQSPENKKLFNQLKGIWLVSGTKTNADDYNIESAIQLFREKVQNENQKSTRVITFHNLIKYAAVFILVLLIPISYYTGKRNIPGNTFSTVSCALGDKSLIYLPDSSKVWLNSGSIIKFNNNFKKGDREVFLEGEAYFSVRKDKNNPFVVNSGEINVEVLGTEFNLKAYPDENKISTTLITGSVRITSPNNSSVIKPGQKMVYNNKTKKMVLFKLTDTSPETEWKDGRLVFRNESLEDLQLKLERWFDVDIVLADETVKNRRYTGVLERESILEVMSYFSRAHSVSYKIEGNKVTFYTKK